MSRRGGMIYVKVDGQIYDAVGSFTYNLGRPQREALVGHDGVHGYKELPQVPYIEGEFRDSASLNVERLLTITGATVTLELANGKVIALRDAWFAGEGQVQTEEGNISVRFEGLQAEEIR